ncbi:hepatocyte cell adhesion molecule-like isoform X1 [Pygocentrus nattereri]|uniref:hepatocyte cell adhesion molecule-like isoform X1 n=1 Tax=Pygocentrus nattereri TaxID=42514 RepID=UPI0018919311|nr:hepatocyte cell adhesion molecule-like isoform X1 [Pygocentrus nattereri]
MMKTAKFHHQRWTLLLFCLWEIFISESVSSTSAQKVLNGAVGESITLPTRVFVSSNIDYEGKTIGQLMNNQVRSFREFTNRLHWDNQSGFFTLSHLRTDDSGVYTVDDAEEDKKEVYELNVYDKVSAPQVKKLNSSPSESEFCSLQCSVRNVRGLNLFWFKAKVLLNHTNSSSLNDTLNLFLETARTDKDTYTCVTSNPVSKQTITVNITEHCLNQPGAPHRSNIIAIVLPVIFVLLIIVMVILLRRRKRHSEISRHTEDFWRKKSTCLQEKQQNDPDLLTEVIYTTAGP